MVPEFGPRNVPIDGTNSLGYVTPHTQSESEPFILNSGTFHWSKLGDRSC